MRFLAPGLLAGLALAALPIIIHLINRRRAVRRAFPAIEFLLRSEKKIARKLKVKQLLLLLMRVLILLFVPLAMAQPYLLSESGSTAADRLPSALVIVLDDSFSLSHVEAGESSWDWVTEQLDETLDGLRTWDQVALVLAHEDATTPVPELTEDHSEVRDALDDLAGPSHRGSDLAGALTLAAEIHAAGQLPVRRTLVLTDSTQRAWDGVEAMPPDFLAMLGELEVVQRPLPEGGAGNVAFVEAGFGEPSTGAEGDIELWATIQNFGDYARPETRVDLVLDGQVLGTALVQLDANASVTQTFTVALPEGGLHRAEMRLRGGDINMTADDRVFLTVHMDRQVRALLVNGDPRNVPYRDELFYLERALGVGGVDESGISVHIEGTEGLDESFSDYDVVVLSNVARLSQVQVAELTAFVEAGGGLLFSLGSQVDADQYNELFGALLPKRLRSVRELCSPRDPDAGLLATRLARLESSHPVFRVFDLPGGESIQSVSVYSYMLLEPSPLGRSETLLSYGDGGPALVERAVGSGRVALLTTSIDRDWTDLPIRTAFLPLMRRTVRYLARRGATEGGQTGTVGERFSLDVESQSPERVTIIAPNQERYVLTPRGGAEGTVSMVPETPGHYEVRLDIAGEERAFDELMFSVNVPSDESDPLPPDDGFVAGVVEAARLAAFQGDPTDVPERRVSLWPPMLFLAVILMYAESMLAARRRFWQRIGERFRGLRRGEAGSS